MDNYSLHVGSYPAVSGLVSTHLWIDNQLIHKSRITFSFDQDNNVNLIIDKEIYKSTLDPTTIKNVDTGSNFADIDDITSYFEHQFQQ